VGVVAGASVAALYRPTDLACKFALSCYFCPPEGEALQRRIDQSDDGWAAGVSLDFGVNFKLQTGQTIGLIGTVDYLDETGKVENQSSGDAILSGATTRLATDSQTNWRVAVSAWF